MDCYLLKFDLTAATFSAGDKMNLKYGEKWRKYRNAQYLPLNFNKTCQTILNVFRERRVSSRQNNNKTAVAMNPTTVESPTSKQSLPSQNRRKRPLPEDSSLPEAKKFRGRGAEEDTGPPRTSNRVRK